MAVYRINQNNVLCWNGSNEMWVQESHVHCCVSSCLYTARVCRYLRHMYSRIQPPRGAIEPCGFHTFASLVRRSLVTMATRFLQPHSTTHHWSDFNFHNEVVDMFLATLPRGLHATVYEDMLRLMPGNVVLTHRSVSLGVALCKHTRRKHFHQLFVNYVFVIINVKQL